MRPNSAMDNSANGADVDAERTRQPPLAFTSSDSLPNLSHKVGGQDGVTVSLAVSVGAARSTFPCRILHVVCGSASEKMSRVHAWWIVTAMEYIQVSRDWPIGQLIGQAVSTIWRFALSRAQLSITAMQARSRPQPAGIRTTGAINLLPKPIGNRTRLYASLTRCSARGAGARAILGAIGWETPEGSTTDGTNIIARVWRCATISRHGSQLLSCRAGGVRSTAQHFPCPDANYTTPAGGGDWH